MKRQALVSVADWALLRKNLSQTWLLLAACSVALAMFCWIRVWLVAQIEMDRFQRIVENLPEAMKRLSPVPLEELFTYAGRISYVYEEPIVYLVMAIWAIATASDSVSGELGRGTMEMLLAQPIGRLRVLSHHVVIMLAGAVVLSAVAYFTTAIAIHSTLVDVTTQPQAWTIPLLGVPIPLTFAPPEPRPVPLDELVAPSLLLPATINYACLGFFLIGLTTFLSSWDSYRWRTIGLAVGFYVIQSLVELLAASLESEGLRRLTFFGAYEPVRFVTASVNHPEQGWRLLWSTDPLTLGPLGCDLILAGLGLAGLLAGAVIFHLRDLSAPV
jgi:ABC-2 type transport system permease protein